MASLANRQNVIDQWVAINWDDLVALMEAGIPGDANAWQGPWTHDAPVSDGQGQAPDLTRRARQGMASWIESGWSAYFPGNGGGRIDFRISIDEYWSGAGSGFIARIQLEHRGAFYERSWATGPDALTLTLPWSEFTEAV